MLDVALAYLAIFCAQAGAKRVYAVDASDIAVQANEVVKANNLAEKVIVLHGRVEDVEIDEEVDVIISEWMGYMLLYESMLESVITARDRWLKRGGLILPSNAKLYMAPITHPDGYNDSMEFWRNVYGIDMSAMLQLAKQCAFEELCVETISGKNVLTWPHVVKHVDCYTIQLHEPETQGIEIPLAGFPSSTSSLESTPIVYTNKVQRKENQHHLRREEKMTEQPPKLQCERSGCKATFTEDDNPEGSCTYHDAPIFHNGMKEWSCCKKKEVITSTYS